MEGNDVEELLFQIVRESPSNDNKAEKLNEVRLSDRMGSGAWVEGLTLNKSVDKESILIGKKAKYDVAEVVSWHIWLGEYWCFF